MGKNEYDQINEYPHNTIIDMTADEKQFNIQQTKTMFIPENIEKKEDQSKIDKQKDIYQNICNNSESESTEKKEDTQKTEMKLVIHDVNETQQMPQNIEIQ